MHKYFSLYTHVDLRTTFFKASRYFLILSLSCWPIACLLLGFLFVFKEMINCRYEGWLGIKKEESQYIRILEVGF